jgi:hypothetical protein
MIRFGGNDNKHYSYSLSLLRDVAFIGCENLILRLTVHIRRE